MFASNSFVGFEQFISSSLNNFTIVLLTPPKVKIIILKSSKPLIISWFTPTDFTICFYIHLICFSWRFLQIKTENWNFPQMALVCFKNWHFYTNKNKQHKHKIPSIYNKCLILPSDVFQPTFTISQQSFVKWWKLILYTEYIWTTLSVDLGQVHIQTIRFL